MITKSQASQLTELLGLPEAEVDDMTVVDGVGLFLALLNKGMNLCWDRHLPKLEVVQ